MTVRPAFVMSMVGLYCAAALLHWVMWLWLCSVAPRWFERHRRLSLAVLMVLFVLPLSRGIGFLHPGLPAWSILSALGMLWHLTVCMGMSAVGLLRGAGWLSSRCARKAAAREDAPLLDRRQALEGIGGAVAFAASGATLGWGTLRGRYEWTIEEIPIRLARLPKALDGFTIVQISDLHVGTFIGDRELAMGLGLIDRIGADLIAITGDIVDADARYVSVAARRLGALRAREGVVCIPGNHDYYTGGAAVLGGMQRAGIDVLVNRGKVIAKDDGGIALLGVDDLSVRAPQRGQGPDIGRAKSMVPPDLATILLAHQPRFAAIASEAGVDLQLSGHTHGGQINPLLRPIDFFYRYVAGRYQVGSMQLYVNRGFGTVGPPTRVGAPPEITKIVLVAG